MFSSPVVSSPEKPTASQPSRVNAINKIHSELAKRQRQSLKNRAVEEIPLPEIPFSGPVVSDAPTTIPAVETNVHASTVPISNAKRRGHCELCNCQVGVGKPFKQHCQGKKHQANLAKLLAADPVVTGSMSASFAPPAPPALPQPPLSTMTGQIGQPIFQSGAVTYTNQPRADSNSSSVWHSPNPPRAGTNSSSNSAWQTRPPAVTAQNSTGPWSAGHPPKPRQPSSTQAHHQSIPPIQQRPSAQQPSPSRVPGPAANQSWSGPVTQSHQLSSSKAPGPTAHQSWSGQVRSAHSGPVVQSQSAPQQQQPWSQSVPKVDTSSQPMSSESQATEAVWQPPAQRAWSPPPSRPMLTPTSVPSAAIFTTRSHHIPSLLTMDVQAPSVSSSSSKIISGPVSTNPPTNTQAQPTVSPVRPNPTAISNMPQRKDSQNVTSRNSLPSAPSTVRTGFPRSMAQTTGRPNQSSPYVYVAKHQLEESKEKEQQQQNELDKSTPVLEQTPAVDSSSKSNAVMEEGASSEFCCPLCRIRTQNVQAFRAHLACALHAQNAKEKGHKFKSFKCDICNVRGLPYSDDNFMNHLTSKSHLCVKACLLNDLIRQANEPSGNDDGDNRIEKRYIFKFSERGGGLVECTLCNRVFPSGAELLSHQQNESHAKKLAALEEKIPVLYFCELCEMSTLGKDASMKHVRSQRHLRAVAGALGEDCPAYYRLEICKQGDQCLYRHCPGALATVVPCANWVLGKCERVACPLRHPKLPTPDSGKEKESTTARSHGQDKKSSTEVPCKTDQRNDVAIGAPNNVDKREEEKVQPTSSGAPGPSKAPFAFTPANVELLKKLVSTKLGKWNEQGKVEKTGQAEGVKQGRKEDGTVGNKKEPDISKQKETLTNLIAGTSKSADAADILTKLLELGSMAKSQEKSGLVKNVTEKKLEETVEKPMTSKKAKMEDELEGYDDSEFLLAQLNSLCSNSNGGDEKDEDALDELLTGLLENEKRRLGSSEGAVDQKVKLMLIETLVEKRKERREGEKTVMALMQALAQQNQSEIAGSIEHHRTESSADSSMEDARELAMDYFLRSTTEVEENEGTTTMDDSVSTATPDLYQLLSCALGATQEPSLMEQLASVLTGGTDLENTITSVDQVTQLLAPLLDATTAESLMGLISGSTQSDFLVPPPDFSVPPPSFSIAPELIPATIDQLAQYIPPQEDTPVEEVEEDPLESLPLEFITTNEPLAMSTGLNAVHTLSRADLEAQLSRFNNDNWDSVPFVFGGKDWIESAAQRMANGEDGGGVKVEDMELCEDEESNIVCIGLDDGQNRRQLKTRWEGPDRQERYEDERRRERSMERSGGASGRDGRDGRDYRANRRRSRSRSRSRSVERRRCGRRDAEDLRERLSTDRRRMERDSDKGNYSSCVWNERNQSGSPSLRGRKGLKVTVYNDRYGTGDLYDDYAETWK